MKRLPCDTCRERNNLKAFACTICPHGESRKKQKARRTAKRNEKKKKDKGKVE